MDICPGRIRKDITRKSISCFIILQYSTFFIIVLVDNIFTTIMFRFRAALDAKLSNFFKKLRSGFRLLHHCHQEGEILRDV